MRIIRLALTDLASIVRRRGGIAVILVISIVTASLCLAIFTGMNAAFIKTVNQRYEDSDINALIGKMGGPLPRDGVVRLYERLEKEKIKDYRGMTVYSEIYYYPGINFTLAGISVCYFLNPVESGEYINEDDIRNRSRVVNAEWTRIMDSGTAGLGETAVVMGHEYILKGVCTYSSRIENIAAYCGYKPEKGKTADEIARKSNNVHSSIIPITTYFDDGYDIYAVRFTFDKYPSSSTIKQIKKIVSETVGECDFVEPVYVSPITRELIEKVIMYGGMILICLINIMALIVAWYKLSVRRHAIYRVCGAGSKTLFKLMLAETEIIVAFSVLLSYLFYTYCNWIFVKVDIVFDIENGTWMFVLAALMALSCAAVYRPIKRIAGESPAQIIR